MQGGAAVKLQEGLVLAQDTEDSRFRFAYSRFEQTWRMQNIYLLQIFYITENAVLLI